MATSGHRSAGQSSSVSWKSLEPRQTAVTSRSAVGKSLKIEQCQQEPIRSILRQASTVLNVRGRQFNNLVDVNLSDDEKEISTLPPKSSEPPVSISLKRAFGIKEPSKSGQTLMDFFDDRWMEFQAPTESSNSVPKKNRRRQLQPVLVKPISVLRRPWNAHMCDEAYDPPDPARPPTED